MAIKQIALTCDGPGCGYESEEEFEDERDVFQSGWLILKGADWLLGTDEKVYCSMDCLRADQP